MINFEKFWCCQKGVRSLCIFSSTHALCSFRYCFDVRVLLLLHANLFHGNMNKTVILSFTHWELLHKRLTTTQPSQANEMLPIKSDGDSEYSLIWVTLQTSMRFFQCLFGFGFCLNFWPKHSARKAHVPVHERNNENWHRNRSAENEVNFIDRYTHLRQTMFQTKPFILDIRRDCGSQVRARASVTMIFVFTYFNFHESNVWNEILSRRRAQFN